MKRRILFAAIATTAFLAACGGSKPAETTAAPATTAAPTTTAAPETKAPETEAPETEAVDQEKEQLRAKLKDEHGISPSTFVRGDKTGNWRISKVADATPPADYAVDYARAYMEEGDVHYVVNFTLKTTTQYKLFLGTVEAKTTEYVDKEEHDASVIGRGMELTERYFKLDTGEEVKVEADAAAGAADSGDLVAAVEEAIDGAVGEGEKITGVDFDGKDLKITVDLSGVNGPFSPADIAIARISSITDEILALDDTYYNTWETVTVDFGGVGKATLDKSMVKDQGFGRFFDFPDSVLK